MWCCTVAIVLVVGSAFAPVSILHDRRTVDLLYLQKGIVVVFLPSHTNRGHHLHIIARLLRLAHVLLLVLLVHLVVVGLALA